MCPARTLTNSSERGSLRPSGLLAAAIIAGSGCKGLQTTDGRVDWDQVGEAAGSVRAAFDDSPEKENMLGRELAANLAARFGLLQDEAATRYLSLVGLAVARKSERGASGWRFGILDTAAVNAYAAPGGFVFVTRGLLKRINSEAELAGVLAHEVAHVELRHSMKALKAAKLLEAGGKAAKAAGAKDPKLGLAAGFLIGLADKGFSRADEAAADSRGVALAGAAGYVPQGLPDALQKLYGAAEDKPLAAFGKRHPPLSARKRALDAALKSAPARGVWNPKRFRLGLATL